MPDMQLLHDCAYGKGKVPVFAAFIRAQKVGTEGQKNAFHARKSVLVISNEDIFRIYSR